MRRIIRVVAGALAVSCAVVGAGLPAQAQVAPPVGVGDGGGGVIDGGPAGTPALSIFATCTVRNGKGVTSWFGYTNSLTQRVNVDVGNDNATTVNSLVQANGGQVVQFQPGTVQRAFAVLHPVNSSAGWVVTSPIFDGSALIGSARVTASDAGAPACPAGTPTRWVGVQSTVDSTIFEIPEISVSSVYDRRDRSGKLIASAVNYSVNKVKSTCSAGGTPLPPRVLWGFGGPTQQYGPSFTLNLVTPAAYRPPTGVIRTDADANYSFARTWVGVRQVADPQALTDFSGGDAALAARLPATRGLSSETVLADVYGRCSFDGDVMMSKTVLWVDAFGRPFSLYTNTETSGVQRTRLSVRCSPVATYPGPITGCDVPIDSLSGPGGRIYR
jgi:hypothetical protein